MLLFDDSKKLEKALGEEAAAVIVHVFEKMDTENKRELATKADLENGLLAVRTELEKTEARLMAAISNSRAETMKWTVGMLIAQAALVATLVKLL